MDPEQPMVTPSSEGEGQVSQAAMRILEQAGVVQKAGTGQEAKGSGDAQPPSELTLDFDGVERTVKVSDLATAFREREQTAATKATVDAQMRQLGALDGAQQMLGLIGKMGPQQRAKLQQYLQDPASLDEPEREETDDGDEADDDIAGRVAQRLQGNGSKPKQRASNGRVEVDAQEYELLKAAVVELAQAEHGRRQDGHRKTVAEQVSAKMDEFPVFKDRRNKAIREFAEDSIRAQLQSDPDASVEKLVTKAAQRLGTMKADNQREVLEEVGLESPELPPLPKNRRSLANGDVRRAAERILTRR